MRYCEYCGAQQDDDALFCTQCGQRLSPLDIPPDEEAGSFSTDVEEFMQAEVGLPRQEEGHVTTPSVNAQAIADESAPLSLDKEIIVEDNSDARPETPWMKQNMRWLIPVCIVTIGALLGVGAYFFFLNKGNEPLNIEKPQWTKYIVAADEGVPVHKEASISSPLLMVQVENTIESMELYDEFCWGDESLKRGFTREEYHLLTNKVLPVLEEVDDWYRVQVDNFNGDVVEGYISKERAIEITPTPITIEVLEKINAENEWRYYYLVKNGKYKNLCIVSEFNEYEGASEINLSFGMLSGGFLYFPAYKDIIMENNNSQEVQFVERNGFPQLLYGPEHLHNSTYGIFDPQYLTNELIAEILGKIGSDTLKNGKVVCYFPAIPYNQLQEYTYQNDKDLGKRDAANSPDEGEVHITGYNIMSRDNEDYLVALLSSGGYEETNVTYPSYGSVGLVILDYGDYDGDGEMEAVIQENDNGTSGCEPPFVVYYDKATKQYRPTERFGKWDKVYTIKKDGETMLYQRYGIREDFYTFKGNKLQLTGTESHSAGSVLKRFTKEGLFPDNRCEETASAKYDIDDNSFPDTFIFYHGCAHPHQWGAYMSLESIAREFDDPANCSEIYASDSFSILSVTTQGMHDILVGESYLFRWNGFKYEEWVWNGSEITMKE